MISYFKDAIEKLEKVHGDKHDVKRSLPELQMLENIYSKEDVIPKDFNPDSEE